VGVREISAQEFMGLFARLLGGFCSIETQDHAVVVSLNAVAVCWALAFFFGSPLRVCYRVGSVFKFG
jgi:hypothetical protein